MAFWDLSNVEPKRNFRYKITFPGSGETGIDFADISIYAQKVSKPSFTITTTDYQYLNHKFKYPGRVDWQDITMEFVDSGTDQDMYDMAQKLMGTLAKAGYAVPKANTDLKTISKAALTTIVGGANATISIEQLNAAGTTIEEWTIHNPMFTDVKFSELSYGSEDISTISVTVKYDYAILTMPTTNTSETEGTGTSDTEPPAGE